MPIFCVIDSPSFFPGIWGPTPIIPMEKEEDNDIRDVK